MLTPREATEAPTQGSRSPLSPTEVTELATVRLFLILSALLCSLRPGFCIVCDFAHARPIMLQHSTSYTDYQYANKLYNYVTRYGKEQFDGSAPGCPTDQSECSSSDRPIRM